ncbi:MAG: hypothetical protein ACM31D_13765 [Bacteroidota bacterium]
MALTAVILTMMGTAQGWACSRDPNVPEPTAEELFANAATVVVGHLIKVEQVAAADIDKHDAGVIEGTFSPIEIIKGEAPADNKVKSQTFFPGNCTLPLLVGSDYVFFLDGKDNFVSWITGSASLGFPGSPAVERAREKLRSLRK